MWLEGLRPYASLSRQQSSLETVDVNSPVVGRDVNFSVRNYGYAKFVVTEGIAGNSLTVPEQPQRLAAIGIGIKLRGVIGS